MSDSFVQSLTVCYEARKSYIEKNKLEAFRLVHFSEIELPVYIDIYKDNAVVHLFDALDALTLADLESSLKKTLPLSEVFYKNRTKQEFALPVRAPKEITVSEYGNTFLINLSEYLDLGLFLDHRETRKWIQSVSRGKVVLNTFAYTGSFSVYAAKGGAEKTYSVDLSRTYCEWIKKNLALNNLPPEKNWVYKMDTLEFFRYAKRKKLIFDIIIIDPPTFSKNKGQHFSVQKDHPLLLTAALEILSPTGFIVFSNNFTDFVMKKSALPSCIITERTDMIPPDFPGMAPHRCFIVEHPKPEIGKL